ncbi:MAG: hypothetical protein KatS3mg121_1102 [Gammaproteobacteria bacterium]|nr:MAG: hypothetical protein KatS3mg121_1102 [Gammaproteobacteria bacterium]
MNPSAVPPRAARATGAPLARLPVAVKLGALFAALAATAVGGLGAFLALQQERLLDTQLAAFGRLLAERLAAVAAEPLLAEDRLALRLLVAEFGGGEPLRGAAVYALDGSVLASWGDVPARVPPADTWRPADGAPRLGYGAPVRFKAQPVGRALVVVSAAALDAARHRARWLTVWTTAAGVLLAAAAAAWLARRAARPIRRLAAAGRAIREGRLDLRLAERRGDEIGELIESINALGEGLLRRAQVEAVLQRYLSRPVAERLLADLDQVRLGGRRIEATVLFADIVGFTALAEQMPEDAVSAMLNRCFALVTAACRQRGGLVDKFIGDGAMLVFGALGEDSEHALNGVCCALLIQRAVAWLGARRPPPLALRVGLNSGPMLLGNLGAAERMEFTVVGDAVNLASRLCDQAAPGEVVVTEDVYRLAGGERALRARPRGHVALRGRRRPAVLYVVDDVQPRHRPALAAQLEEVCRAVQL